jgi:rhamnose transport system ATP-binding protein
LIDRTVDNHTLVITKGLHKSFGGVKALKGIDFTLRSSSVHALLGENGAGKSTLIKILSGALRPDSGTITINGKRYDHLNPSQALRAGIASVYQEISLYPDLSVLENLFVGQYKRNRFGLIDWAWMRDQAISVFKRLGVSVHLTKPVAELGKADAQLVEIARALLQDAKVLILDEPTTALTESEVETLIALVRSLAEKGTGIIYISHRLEEVLRVADEITVLRDGFTAANSLADKVDRDWLVSNMLGKQINRLYRRSRHSPGDEVLRLENLSSPSSFQNVSFSLKSGEVVSVVGLLGSGGSRVLRAVFGVEQISHGTIFIKGKPFQPRPFNAAKNHIALVPEDRKTEGLVLDLTARTNLSLADLRAITHYMVVSKTKMDIRAVEAFKSLDIKPDRPKLVASSFSGGNQQKIVVGKWLSVHPELLLLEEPTQGIDVGAKAEVHRIIDNLARSGVAILMFSSDLPEVEGIADRILVFRKGRLSRELPSGTKASVILASMSAD